MTGAADKFAKKTKVLLQLMADGRAWSFDELQTATGWESDTLRRYLKRCEVNALATVEPARYTVTPAGVAKSKHVVPPANAARIERKRKEREERKAQALAEREALLLRAKAQTTVEQAMASRHPLATVWGSNWMQTEERAA